MLYAVNKKQFDVYIGSDSAIIISFVQIHEYWILEKIKSLYITPLLVIPLVLDFLIID